jgi:IMP dehydrogenase
MADLTPHPKIIGEALTFDDVLVVPRRASIHPRDIDVTTQLTRHIRINIPLISAPMDTVTESTLAIALAQEGGIGIIHRNLSSEDQTREVRKVKRSESGVILDPVTLRPEDAVGRAQEIMRLHNVSGIPITRETHGPEYGCWRAAKPTCTPISASVSRLCAACCPAS